MEMFTPVSDAWIEECSKKMAKATADGARLVAVIHEDVLCVRIDASYVLRKPRYLLAKRSSDFRP